MLYQAKGTGRNNVQAAPVPTSDLSATANA